MDVYMRKCVYVNVTYVFKTFFYYNYKQIFNITIVVTRFRCMICRLVKFKLYYITISSNNKYTMNY